MDKIPDVIMVGIAVGVFVGGTVWGLAWWLSGQFSGIRHSIYDLVNKAEQSIINKLEYHEKHDDTRFDDIKKDIWEMRLRQASDQASGLRESGLRDKVAAKAA